MSMLLTTQELADHLKVTPATVREWVNAGRITPIRLSRKSLRFDLASVLHQLHADSPKPQSVTA